MRFISCHIENFGTLHNYDFSFNTGLNVLLEPNGFGKSSFAAFLCAMLYGLPRSRQELSKNPRRKYAPWQGGVFGGSLCFLADGTAYRVERSFGETPAGDSFELYELEPLRKSKHFGDNLGMELFGLDASSFTRSCYLPQLWDGGSLRTDAISAKLNNLLDDTNDVNNFESAIAKLRSARSSFVPYRDTGGGLAAEAGRELSRLQTELAEEPALRQRLAEREQELLELKARADALKQRREELEAELERAPGRAVRDMAQKRLAELDATLEGYARELEALRSKYPKGLPSDDVLWRMEELTRLLTAREAKPGTELHNTIDENARRFARGVPDGAYFEGLEQLRRQSVAIKAELAIEESAAAADTEKLEKQELFFEQGVPGSAELDGMKASVLRARELALKEGSDKPKPSRLSLILLIVGLVALGAGLVLTLMLRQPLGHPLLALGIVGFFAGLRLMTGGRSAARVAWAAYERTLRELSAFLEPYPLAPADPETALYELCSRRDALLELRKKVQEHESKTNGLRQQAKGLEDEIRLSLAPYFTREDKDLERQLESLRRLSYDYTQAKRREAAESRAMEDERREQSASYATLAAGYGLAPTPGGDVMRQVRADCSREKFLLSELERGDESIKRLWDEHGVLLYEKDTGPSFEALRLETQATAAKLSAVELSLAKTERELQELCLRLNKLNEKRSSAEQAAARLEQARANACTLDLAIEYLAKAKRQLAERCLGDIRESFLRYLRRLWAEEADEVLLDEDFRPSFVINGKLRTPEYFSAGSVDLVLLCLRLALVDALFRGNQPPLILDDPFVNLDDRHCALSLELLHKLAEDRQILYLSCNSSRV